HREDRRRRSAARPAGALGGRELSAAGATAPDGQEGQEGQVEMKPRGSSHNRASKSFTLASIKRQTSRYFSGGRSLGSGMSHSSRRRAGTRGQPSSQQPMPTTTSNSPAGKSASDLERCRVSS